MSGKVVVLNGKRFIVGNSRIRPTKCHLEPKRKKQEDHCITTMSSNKRKQEKVFKRKPVTTSRKIRNSGKALEK